MGTKMKLRTILFVVITLVFGAFIYHQINRDYVVTTEDDGSVTAKVIAATLFASSDLRVIQIAGTVQGTGRTSRLWGWLPSSQVVKAPFTVDYLVHLGQLGSGSYRFDEGRRVLFVQLPDVEPQKPNIDLANTTLSETTGVFVTRGAMAELGKKVAGSAQTVALEFARSSKNMEMARRNGRKAAEQLFSGVLKASKSDVRVEVRFANEPLPLDREQWDLTRSLQDILSKTTLRQ